MKKLIFVISAFMAVVSISGCSNKKNPVLKDYSIHRDEEFGGAYIDISIDGFNKLGFKFGDSVNLSFSNDVEYKDIGYYSGYYVPAGQELVVGYPGYDYIKFCINYGDDVYTMNKFDENTKVTITVNKVAKYKTIEDTLSISYSDEISSYDSEEEFANFREITAGNVKPGMLYRGASPIDNRRKRASTVDGLLLKNGIEYNIDLADKGATGSNFVVGPYFQSLLDTDKVVFLGMAAAYKSDDFSMRMKTMFESILNNEGPYYIHCLEGKDRTGFVCMVIEALLGADYDELVDDYFITYHNYYGIEKGTEKYEVIKELHIDEMIRFVFDFDHTVNLLGANYYSKANSYLLAIGLTQEQINAVQDKLSKEF